MEYVWPGLKRIQVTCHLGLGASFARFSCVLSCATGTTRESIEMSHGNHLLLTGTNLSAKKSLSS